MLCSALTGAAVSFQVTVDNPGALTISLNGANSITIECGQPFSDPGAAAIDGGGQPLEVTVSYTGDFNSETPATGTYTATYTATEGANSVSTTRTIVRCEIQLARPSRSKAQVLIEFNKDRARRLSIPALRRSTRALVQNQ